MSDVSNGSIEQRPALIRHQRGVGLVLAVVLWAAAVACFAYGLTLPGANDGWDYAWYALLFAGALPFQVWAGGPYWD